MRFATPPQLQRSVQLIHALARSSGTDAWVVGGTVRDVLLRRDVRDLDIAVAGDAVGFARSLSDALAGHFVLLDDANAVARVALDDGELAHIDVSALQGALEQDMRRRDFTIDAMAVPVGQDTEVYDPCGGTVDLKRRVVRMTAPKVFDDDPLRLLRAPRIASELGFAIEVQTATEIRARTEGLDAAAAERRRDELARMFELPAAGAGVRLLDELGLLDVLLPEVTAGRAVSQPREYHVFDVLEHNLRALEAMDILLADAPPDDTSAWIWSAVWRAFAWRGDSLRDYLSETLTEGRSCGGILKLAALLHDVGKPETRTEDAHGRVRFLGHADRGAMTAKHVMRRLRYSSREIDFVSLLVREHLRPVQLAQVGQAPSGRALYRFHRDLGDAVPAVLFLALADAAASRGPLLTREGWSRQVAYMNSLLVRLEGPDGIVNAPRIVTGHDIMAEFGLAEGPVIGRLLEALQEAQSLGEVTDRQGALSFLRARLEDTKSKLKGRNRQR